MKIEDLKQSEKARKEFEKMVNDAVEKRNSCYLAIARLKARSETFDEFIEKISKDLKSILFKTNATEMNADIKITVEEIFEFLEIQNEQIPKVEFEKLDFVVDRKKLTDTDYATQCGKIYEKCCEEVETAQKGNLGLLSRRCVEQKVFLSSVEEELTTGILGADSVEYIQTKLLDVVSSFAVFAEKSKTAGLQ